MVSAILSVFLLLAALPRAAVAGTPTPSRRSSVLLWPVGSTPAGELPTRIDGRFDRADAVAFAAELAGFQARAQDDARARLGAVERGLVSARDHYAAQRWDAMTAELEQLEAAELALLADPRHCDALWELEFRLGLAARGRKQADLALRRILFALALAPERRPAREVYGPEVVAEFTDATLAQSAHVAVPVGLDVLPADAVVHVDCKPVHGSHVDLRPGLHVIHARAMGHQGTAALFEVPAQTRIVHALPEDPGADAVARLGHGLAAGNLVLELQSHRRALVEAAAARGIDVVVVVEATADAATARALVGQARGPKLRRPTIEAAVADVLAMIADDGTLRAAPGPATGAADPPLPPPKPRKPIVRAWWLWTTVAVVVAAGVGLGLGLGLRDDQGDRIIIYGPR